MFACSLKVSCASDSATKAVLLKDKPSKSPKEDSPPELQQYIEVGRVLAWHTSHPAPEVQGAVSVLFGMMAGME